MSRQPAQPDPGAALYTPAEVGIIFRVDPKTVTRWAKSGRIPPDQIVRTIGGHRRVRGDYVRAQLAGDAK